jgi:phosphoserine aminotransferase
MNFNPGPAALPLAALEQARDELLDFQGTGMSIIEHSHRGPTYEAVHYEAMDLLRELLSIPDDYDVLLLQGGASQQFAMVPMNFLRADNRARYTVTGSWSDKATGEARAVAALYGSAVEVAARCVTEDSAGEQLSRMPAAAEMRDGGEAVYLHVTTNETIDGLQFPTDPETAVFDLPADSPLVADMSSDLLSRRIDVGQFALIYAGAQKNFGPSGVTVVIARREFIAAGRDDLPVIFSYKTHSKNRSLYNTPPTFAVYLLRNVLRWIKSSGGVAAIERENRRKSSLLYAAIDRYPALYACPAAAGSRSTMNVVFRLPSDEIEKRFLAGADEREMVGLAGHRSVGGVRVSCYNAVTLEWVQALCAYMEEFAADGAS